MDVCESTAWIKMACANGGKSSKRRRREQEASEEVKKTWNKSKVLRVEMGLVSVGELWGRTVGI